MIEYKSQGINLYNQDCMEYMRMIPDKHFDWVITDVPYGINVAKMPFTRETDMPCKQKNGSILRVKKSAYKQSEWDNTTPTQEYFNEVCRISKNQIIFGVEYVNWIGLGNGRIKWNKLVPAGLSFKKYEMAYCSTIDKIENVHYLWAGFCQGRSVLNPTTQQGNKKLNEKRIHPCHKPTLLWDIILNRYVTPFSKILDTHMGGASLAISIIKRNKYSSMPLQFVGCEIDNDYFERSVNRIKAYQSQTTLF